jgi:hypothetical protein
LIGRAKAGEEVAVEDVIGKLEEKLKSFAKRVRKYRIKDDQRDSLYSLGR